MAKTPEEMAASMLASVPEKTGKTLAQWKQLIAKAKLVKHGEIVKMLKSDHGVTHGYANLVAHEFLSANQPAEEGGDDLVAAQYSGAKADLKPIYEALVNAFVNWERTSIWLPKRRMSVSAAASSSRCSSHRPRRESMWGSN